jgi:hypothetical protein
VLIRLANYDLKSKILKQARNLKESIDFKNVVITPDYSIQKRFAVKILIRTRINLNKKLKENEPNANYYFSIKNGRIVMLSKSDCASTNNPSLNDIDNKETINLANASSTMINKSDYASSNSQLLNGVNYIEINNSTKSSSSISKLESLVESALTKHKKVFDQNLSVYVKQIDDLKSKLNEIEAAHGELTNEIAIILPEIRNIHAENNIQNSQNSKMHSTTNDLLKKLVDLTSGKNCNSYKKTRQRKKKK